MTFAEKVITFNLTLEFTGILPPGIQIMNPFKKGGCAILAMRLFYGRYYNDNRQRRAMLGINPGRFGAGITGVPFTDPTRLATACGIDIPQCGTAREPSSVFIYEVIKAYGGVEKFYKDWYINSICPLGFIRENDKGKWLNYNYYDSASLQKAALPFILKTLPEQIAFGLETDVCICLGTGKNAAFLNKLNNEYKFFSQIHALEHPRYIMQYKSRDIEKYIEIYLRALA